MYGDQWQCPCGTANLFVRQICRECGEPKLPDEVCEDFLTSLDHHARRSSGGHIYTASKTKHAPIWRGYRERGWPINSTWIDEAGEGESRDLADLWRRCIAEASGAKVLVVYREPDDLLKGGWVEVGAALASGVPVLAVGLREFTISHDPRITHFDNLDDAMHSAKTLSSHDGL